MGGVHPDCEQDHSRLERPHLEAFQDSGNPGYFLIKLALWLMAVVVILAQAVVDIFSPSKAGDA